MGVDGGELGGAAGQIARDGGDVKVGAGDLEWGRRGLVGGKDACAKGGEFERLFYYDAGFPC